MSQSTFPVRRRPLAIVSEEPVIQSIEEGARRSSRSRPTFTITHPNAFCIDIGSASHFVVVPSDRDDRPVREFASFTADLQALADWLACCVGWTPSRWSRPASTGSRYLTCSKPAASTS